MVSGKLSNIWKPNNVLLSNPQVKEEIRSEIRKNVDLKTQHVHICEIPGSSLAKPKALNTYMRKDETSQINNLSFQFKRGKKGNHYTCVRTVALGTWAVG